MNHKLEKMLIFDEKNFEVAITDILFVQAESCLHIQLVEKLAPFDPFFYFFSNLFNGNRRINENCHIFIQVTIY